MNALILLSIAQVFFASFTLLTSPLFRTRANRLLPWTMLVVAVIGLNNSLLHVDFGLNPDVLDILDDVPWELLFPALLFVYFLHVVKHPLLEQPLYLVLYMPFSAFLAGNIVMT